MKYVKGDGDSFFTRTRGCITNAVRGNYVEKRLKAFISSGIFAQWRVVYASWKPRYLLGHNGNRIGSNVDKVSRLDFSSKITTGFCVFGIGLLICILVISIELLRHKFALSRFNGYY